MLISCVFRVLNVSEEDDRSMVSCSTSVLAELKSEE